jgi:SAM-dependent methyltransferase
LLKPELMSVDVSRESNKYVPALWPPARPCGAGTDFLHPTVVPFETASSSRWPDGIIAGLKRRLRRERRRRKVGRAYDMALEIARLVPRDSKVLDVGCGNGYIAHHLSAMLGKEVVGLDVTSATEAAINYRSYDGANFPVIDNSVDAVLLCYVLHHAQDIQAVLSEVQRVLRSGGTVIVYEDIPETAWDRAVCEIHDRQWRDRTGPCTFRSAAAWRHLFNSHGFEIIFERQLARARNLTHPVSRRFYQLRPAIAR